MRADVARLHAAHTTVHIRHGWMKPLFKDLSTNPYTQYKVHMWGAIYWLINFPLICCLFFFTRTLWLKLGIFITLIYSIYADLATDYAPCSGRGSVRARMRVRTRRGISNTLSKSLGPCSRRQADPRPQPHQEGNDVTGGTAAIFHAGTAPRQRYQGLIRRLGRTVQECPAVAMCWADVPDLSSRVSS